MSDQTRTPDLEAVTRMVADKIAFAHAEFDGTGRAPFIEFGFSDTAAIIAALERAERVEAAAREADRSYIAGLESEDADGIWQTTEWVAFTAAMTALASVLAPAPEGSDGE